MKHYLKVKRIVDIILSFIGLLVSFPLMVVISIAIKLDSKGPILFKQERLGLNGKLFHMYKFRSMVVGAEKGGVYETKGDPRVTRVGKFIRKTSFDEFPQFFNILKGDMSLIGPRPTLPYHPWPLEQYSDEQIIRFKVRPGITGWAQINGRKDLTWGKRIQFDVEYVQNVSFFFDLKIFLKTIIKVVMMKDNLNIGETEQIKDRSFYTENTELATTNEEGELD
ncbi:sugar transferase [Neobacillus citreus]|uniref:Sugar transferase n=1 Tax=Neobacillus citreus TaxID=2833578 RepID=A0A942T3K9_9BACI|nr:sugar transferase [Neobacillus citreus]MCH6265998.1 sugar transferase [Neobacillus citreus]